MNTNQPISNESAKFFLAFSLPEPVFPKLPPRLHFLIAAGFTT